ncbi:unnamed protein product [Phytophthora fragariaefolia]|uniref:Unnamed protein product n=1 Tax=Phytophthora fragariaefolia TaxID=1490495 RepID=A0A9W6TRF6_9STRA|nr:unnamed protein product [Phytophthora fragariaefolia]
MVRSMVFACGLPLSFWGDAAEYAAYILNRSPSKGNPGSKSPMQMLTMRTPDLCDIVAFGSSCTVHHDAKNKSLGERGKPAIIIGKSDEMKRYRVYLPRDRVVVADSKNYGEAMKSPLKSEWTTAMVEKLKVLEEDGVRTVELPPVGSHVLHTKWVFKAKTDADGAIETFQCPPGGLRHRAVVRHRLQPHVRCSHEAEHRQGDPGVRAVLVCACQHGDIPNAYVKAKKEQHLEIYLAIPKGMIVPDEVLRACGVSSYKKFALRLKRSRYGLKQAGRLWSQLLHAKLVELGFTRYITDMCLYNKPDCNNMTIVGVYVNDRLVTASTPDLGEDFVVAMNILSTPDLGEGFFVAMIILSIKDLGKVNKFLGMRVHRDEADGYSLYQQAAIEELLEQFGLADANGVKTPIGEESNDAEPHELQLLPSIATNSKPMIRGFRALVGSLLCIARCTRPDISFAVHKAIRHTHQPRTSDWKLAKRIAQYLKATKALKLRMDVSAADGRCIQVESWSDADFAAGKGDRKSVTGGVVTMDGAIVHWVCKKQKDVSLSTMEAEFTSDESCSGYESWCASCTMLSPSQCTCTWTTRPPSSRWSPRTAWRAPSTSTSGSRSSATTHARASGSPTCEKVLLATMLPIEFSLAETLGKVAYTMSANSTRIDIEELAGLVNVPKSGFGSQIFARGTDPANALEHT